MISEVLQVGTKGADIVLKQLTKIQATKALLMKPAQVRVSLGTKTDRAPSGRDLAENRRAEGPAEEPAKPEKKEKEKPMSEKTAAETGRAIAQGAQTIFQGAASLSTSGLISSLGQALGNIPIVGALFGVAATLGNSALTFKDKIKQAAQEWADTASAANTSTNYARDAQFLRAGDLAGRGRADISVNEQRGIVEALGSSYGRMSNEFKDAIRTLYRGPNGEAYDVRQATQVASGNFEALGTDQGFFMQKIANSLQNLPPSARQALMPDLFEMISKNDPNEGLFRQNDVGIRGVNTQFDDQARAQAASMLNAGPGMAANVANAVQIQGIQNSIDTGLASAAGALVDGLRKIADAIKLMGDNQAAGRPAYEGMRSLFTGGD